MRSRRWVTVTVVVILVVAFVGVGAAALLAGGDSGGSDGGATERATEPTAAPSAAASGPTSALDLRQVLFVDTSERTLKPPLRPGPAEGGENATRNLLRIQCDLQPRPMQPDDNVILCDADGFRYGLGPSELPADAVESAIAMEAPAGGGGAPFLVSIQLTDVASQTFTDATDRVAAAGSPLNRLAVVINGTVVSAPAVQERIEGGQIQITAASQAEAEALANSLQQ